MKKWWNNLSYRQRCTIHALLGVSATPFLVIHLSRIFEAFLEKGSYHTVLALIGLLSIWYVTVHSWMALLTDVMDVTRGDYVVLGGITDAKQINNSRTKTLPYDCLSGLPLKRDRSTWEYALACWSFVEVLMVWIMVPALLYSFTQSPYMHQLISPYGPCGSLLHCIGREILPFAYLLVCFSGFSLFARFNGGISSVHLRILGLANWYPGQNIFPRWLNELMIKMIGRAM